MTIPTNLRAHWISVLASAPPASLAGAAETFGILPEPLWLRRPEVGLAVVRARTGGTGAQFNLGDMTITRCALRLASGEMGVAYIAGRDLRHAELAALFDALLQTEARERVERGVVHPLEALLASRRALTHAQAQSTRVEFMTMVRGDNP